MVGDPKTPIITSLFRFVDDFYKVAPLGVIKKGLQFPRTPAFDVFVDVTGLFEFFK
jgi:hypothetical protein